ncbi:DUF3576 domain-containing protein [Defluviimonas sp. WL0002]|uniref:DUF3576 domain-containing protein n=1 Tax=Albidovulum marisflavi TaxID=2984159 RepID=A0ABT2Z7T6_9RHOB|nr:DUF3576 domain-containing protein [Defluviimonas sp. WL0002]MCV2867208.1 DUF3576 domain-containing protein [Defluviimonas sp. WL0002]
MTIRSMVRKSILGGCLVSLAACGGIGSGDSGWFSRRGPTTDQEVLDQRARADEQRAALAALEPETNRSRIWDLFGQKDDPNVTVRVNKYLWRASLEVLNFLPVESVDPFTGVIVTGYGTPPGGGRAYRATIYVQDPALDARSLKIALVTRGGAPVSPEVARAVEDAIMTRARQLRIRDLDL